MPKNAMIIAADYAAEGTKQYIEAVKLHFKPLLLDNGDATVMPGEITPRSIRALAYDLKTILSGQSGERARESTPRFARTCGMQSVAFGAIRNFATTIKIGRLISERVVLWDILRMMSQDISDALGNDRYSLRLPSNVTGPLAEIAASIVSTAELISDGALTILEHPLAWSDEAQIANRDAGRGYRGVFYGTELGTLLATTLAVSQDLQLHPYSLDAGMTESPIPVTEAMTWFSRPGQATLQAYGDIIADQRFIYIDDISIRDFHRLVTAHCDVSIALSEMLSPRNVTSLTMRERHLSHVKSSIAAAVERQNTAVREQHAARAAELMQRDAGRVWSMRCTLAALGAMKPDRSNGADGQFGFADSSIVAFFCDARNTADHSSIRIPATDVDSSGGDS